VYGGHDAAKPRADNRHRKRFQHLKSSRACSDEQSSAAQTFCIYPPSDNDLPDSEESSQSLLTDNEISWNSTGA
jgi:hypothetical protein